MRIELMASAAYKLRLDFDYNVIANIADSFGMWK